MRLFDVETRRGSLRDKASGVVPTNLGGRLAQNSKGVALHSSAGSFEYGSVDISTTDFSIILWLESVEYENSTFFGEYIDGNNRWYFRVDGTPVFQFYSKTGGSGGVGFACRPAGDTVDVFDGQPICVCINVDRDDTISGYCNNLPLTDISYSPGTLIVSDFELGGYQSGAWHSEHAHIYKCVISDHLLTEQEMQQEYQDFLHAGPIHQLQRPKLWVPPACDRGSVICDYDLSRWSGGVIPDLSGNGNDLTNDTLDPVATGARQMLEESNSCSQLYETMPEELSIEFLVTRQSYDAHLVLSFPWDTNRLRFYFSSSNLNFQYEDTDADLNIELAQGSLPESCQLHVIASAASDALRVWVNGEKTYEGDPMALTPALGDQSCQFFGRGGGVDASSKVTQHFVRVYNIALTEAQAQAQWNKIARQSTLLADGRNARADEVTKTVGEKVIF